MPKGRRYRVGELVPLARLMRQRTLASATRTLMRQRAHQAGDDELRFIHRCLQHYIDAIPFNPFFGLELYSAALSDMVPHIVHAIRRTHLSPRVTLVFAGGDRSIDFTRFPDYHFARYFRLPDVAAVRRLASALGLPPVITRHGYVAERDTAFGVTLARLAYPGRLADMAGQLYLNWSPAKLSSIITGVIHFLADRWEKLVLYDYRPFNDRARLAEFAAAIHDAGGPFVSCVGFLDGTTYQIAKPGGSDMHQAIFYSGHKRQHNVRWQGVVTPDGQFLSMYGPEIGECFVFESSVLARL